MGGIGLMSGVLGALPGLGLLLLSVRGALHMGGACETVIYNNLYYLVSVCCFLPPDQTRNRNLLTEYCTENLKMAIHKGRNM